MPTGWRGSSSTSTLMVWAKPQNKNMKAKKKTNNLSNAFFFSYLKYFPPTGFDPSSVTCYEDLLQYVIRTEQGYQCVCGSFQHRWKWNVQNHLESIHFPGHFVWNCDICGETTKTKNGLSQHKTKFHPKKGIVS